MEALAGPLVPATPQRQLSRGPGVPSSPGEQQDGPWEAGLQVHQDRQPKAGHGGHRTSSWQTVPPTGSLLQARAPPGKCGICSQSGRGRRPTLAPGTSPQLWHTAGTGISERQ